MNIALDRLMYDDNIPFEEMVRGRLSTIENYIQDYSKFLVINTVNEIRLDSVRIIVRELR